MKDMKSFFFSFSLLIFLSLSTAHAAPPIEIQGLSTLTSLNTLSAKPAKDKTSILVFISAVCPCSGSHEELLKDLAVKYPQFQFFGIHSNSDEAIPMSEEHFKKAQLGFPVLQDAKSTWANKLGALKTPHAFVISASGEILYAGGVTDSHVGPQAKKFYLKEVLQDLSENKPARYKEGRALGCYIQRSEGT